MDVKVFFTLEIPTDSGLLSSLNSEDPRQLGGGKLQVHLSCSVHPLAPLKKLVLANLKACVQAPRVTDPYAAFQPPWRNWLARSAVNRKVGGSSPPGGATSTFASGMKQSFSHDSHQLKCCEPDTGSNKKFATASSGNRTRAARVAGEHSTTEPMMLFT